MSNWTALISRARGLGLHLLSPQTLTSIERCASFHEVWAAARLAGVVPSDELESSETPMALELSCRRRAESFIHTLARWTLGDPRVLLPFTLAEDVRSLGSVIRGAVAGIEPADRVRGLIPTPTLGAAALDHLASLATPSAIAAVLGVWRHPLAQPVSRAAARREIEFFELDQSLLIAWAATARSAAARVGDGTLRRHLVETIDLANLFVVRVVAEQRTDARPADLLVPGGSLVTLEDLTTVAESHDLSELRRRLVARASPEFLRTALAIDAADPEGDALSGRIVEMQAWVRQHPFDLGTIALFFLRLRQEQRCLAKAVWKCALGITGQPPTRSVAEGAAA